MTKNSGQSTYLTNFIDSSKMKTQRNPWLFTNATGRPLIYTTKGYLLSDQIN